MTDRGGKERQGREDGIRPETDILAQTVTHHRGRPCGRSSFPKGGGVSLGPSLAGRGTLGLAVTRGEEMKENSRAKCNDF